MMVTFSSETLFRQIGSIFDRRFSAAISEYAHAEIKFKFNPKMCVRLLTKLSCSKHRLRRQNSRTKSHDNQASGS